MAATATTPLRRSSRNAHVKPEQARPPKKAVKVEPNTSRKRVKREQSPAASTPNKKIKTEPSSPSTTTTTTTTSSRKPPKSAVDKAAELQARKLKSFAAYANKSPFPDFKHPTPEECLLAHRILAGLHGDRRRPESVVAPADRAGCGDSPSVLDALVRTILSQNTSDKNSTRAKRSMDAAYGGSDKWDRIAQGGQKKLQEAIQSGGLSVVKSRAILRILEQVHERYGAYSLDHLFQASDDDAMREMLSFQGVGPKTASCVLLFCLRRESFAVDTHVHRITGLLGWRPDAASRDEAHAHLDAMIPDAEKYALHVLLISHGKNCDECKAGGRSVGKCELRRAFRKGKMQGEAGEEVKKEEEEVVEEEKKVKKEEE
ncbi:hypothetical protein S7711_03869 [Stachybotrys chartarum IBT 7711]|uniref:HhH-GPD domain-containing protein n=1 Tax=Stachybotrys chartarum (strain CBS 109288 / IBT 7711) TaxID=1280523 RepID=A0A084AHU7_STACB|nr:hypothetical protein S7711_03869 [Stachybotrys chartarum IBT 7711]